MSNESPNFFDTRTVMAIVLVGATFLGWQFYMQKKYPAAFSKDKTPESSVPVPNAPPVTVPGPETGTKTEIKTTTPDGEKPMSEKVIAFQSENLTFGISSKGMGLKDYQVNQYKDRSGKVIQLGHPEGPLPLETRLLGRAEALDFDVKEVNPGLFVGRATIDGLEITKTMEIHPETYVINFKVATKGSSDRFVGLATTLTEDVDPIASTSFLMPQFEKQEFYVDYSDTHERDVFKKEDLNKSWSQVRVASVGSQYFTQALLDKSPVIPEAKAELNHGKKLAEIRLQYPVLNKNDGLQLEYTAFMGPKSHQLLRAIDPALSNVVDFGFFNWIARQILSVLKWAFLMCGNWGIAVILLTLLVRLIVLPFNVYSYKSMKAMQAIQPKIAAVRERLKDDQQKQQMEIMGLMREHKVNPLGGCLPVLLQFPIFIALYQVLGHSIELYQAPFGLWIHDLSLKDPYYILPVLMGITMFIQQKITPNTMDPAQAKVLMMMPLVFTFFMISLPSGLTLYMLVGAVFSVLQQLYFMRDRKVVAGENQ